jgi:hypothetical protein
MYGGTVNIEATVGNAIIEGATRTYLGGNSYDSETRIAHGAAASAIFMGHNMTTGDISIGAGSSRASGGNLVMGAQVAGSLTQIKGGTLDVDTAADVTLTSGTTMDIQSASTLDMTSVGAMIIDSASTNELNASTTTLVKGGTGLTLTATTGALDLNADGGAVTVDSSSTTTVTGGTGLELTATTGALDLNASSGAATLDSSAATTITAGTTADITSAGELNINATGAASDVYVEAKGAGATTFLGASNADTTTRLHNAGATSSLVIGSAQTSGAIFIGANSSRTGNIDLGSSGGTHETRIRGGDLVLSMSATIDVDAATTLDLTSVGDATITATGASSDACIEATGASGTTFLGACTADTTTRLHNSGITAGLVVGSNQTSGSISIGGGSSRTGEIGFGSGTGTHLTRIRGGTFLLSMSGTVDLASTGAAVDIDSGVTSDITIGDGQTTGDINIGTGSARASGAVIKIGDTTPTADSVLIKGIEMKPDTDSFSPTIGGTSGSDFTQTGASGSYWRWGNMVQVAILLNWTSKSTAAGDIRVGNLPFAFAALPSGTPAPRVYAVLNKASPFTPTGGSVIEAASSAGNTYMNVYEDGSILDVSDATSSDSVEMSITYMLS